MLRAVALTLCLTAAPATACDLALALAVDVSGSVDAREYRVQMQGLADALRDGIVSEALVAGQAAVLVVHWTGSSRQEVVIPWTRTPDFQAVERLAQRVETAPRRWRNFSTAVGEALRFTAQAFDSAPACNRRLIDVSGDGVSNEGIDPLAVRPLLRQRDIGVNALAIEESVPELTAWYWENVIRGDGAFVVTAPTFDAYPEKIRLKLRREVTAQVSQLGTGRGIRTGQR